MNSMAAVIRFKFANMSRETEALQSWIEVSHTIPSQNTQSSVDNGTDLALLYFRA